MGRVRAEVERTWPRTPSKAVARRRLTISLRYLDFLDRLASRRNPDELAITGQLVRRIADLIAWLAALRARLAAIPEPESGTRVRARYDAERAPAVPLLDRLPVFASAP